MNVHTLSAPPQRNPVRARAVERRQYFPWWRIDRRRCAYCHHRCAHWVGLNGGFFRRHARFMAVCFACYGDLWPEDRAWLAAHPDYVPLD